MSRYTIYYLGPPYGPPDKQLRDAMIMGTYPGETEDEALAAFAADDGCTDFAVPRAQLKVSRGDNYRLVKIEE